MKTILLLLLTFASVNAFAQTTTIYGKVIKSDGTRIKGTSVIRGYEDQLIISNLSGGTDNTASIELEVPTSGYMAAFRQGLVTNLLNPKIALLFLTLLPQFVADGEPRLRTTAVLAAVFLGLAVLWWRTFSLAIGPISRVLRGRRPRRVLDAAAGSALLAISARVAVEGSR